MQSPFTSSWQQRPVTSYSYGCRPRATIKYYYSYCCVTEDTYVRLSVPQQSLPFSVGSMESTVAPLGIKPDLFLSPQRCYKHFGHHASPRPAAVQAAGEAPCITFEKKRFAYLVPFPFRLLRQPSIS